MHLALKLYDYFKNNLISLFWTLKNAKMPFLYISCMYMWFNWEFHLSEMWNQSERPWLQSLAENKQQQQTER